MMNTARRMVCSCSLPLAWLLFGLAFCGVGAGPVMAANRVVLCEEFTNLW
jgi:hypothetical protein